MIKTKFAFILFCVLLVLKFPYSIFFLGFDTLTSLIPGWHTNVFGVQLISDFFIFFMLTISVFLYWKLYKNRSEISLKHFLIHLVFTIPPVIFSSSDFFEVFTLNSFDPEDYFRKIYLVICSITFLFVIGQILFWRYYIKITR